MPWSSPTARPCWTHSTDAQELFVRALVAAGHEGRASVHLSAALAAYAAAGLNPSPALRSAARRGEGRRSGLRAATVARSLLRAGARALGPRL